MNPFDYQTWRRILCRLKTGGRFRTGRRTPGTDHPERCGKPAQPDRDLRGDHIQDEQGKAAYACGDPGGKVRYRQGLSDPAGAAADDRQKKAEGSGMPFGHGSTEQSRPCIAGKP